MVRFATLFLTLTHIAVGCVAIPTEDEATGYAKSMVQGFRQLTKG